MGTICQEALTHTAYMHQTFCVPNFIKQTLLDLQEQIDPDTILVRVLNIPLSPIDRLSTPKKKKKQQQRIQN
jgi:hypothetical protein